MQLQCIYIDVTDIRKCKNGNSGGNKIKFYCKHWPKIGEIKDNTT